MTIDENSFLITDLKKYHHSTRNKKKHRIYSSVFFEKKPWLKNLDFRCLQGILYNIFGHCENLCKTLLIKDLPK